MKIENNKVSECRVKLTINADAEEIKDDYNKVVKAYLRDAPIPGFRKGKAPLAIVQKRYGAEMQNEINRRLVTRFLDDAIKQQELKTVSVVDVEDIICSETTGISFAAIVDVEPEFKLPKYQKLDIKQDDTAVSDEEFEKEFGQVRRQHAKSEESEGPAKDGDYLEISFEATSGGKAIEGVPEESNRYIKSEKFWVVAGEAPEYESIPGSAKAMLGLKKGDDFSFDVKFPNDFSVESLRKVKATYTGKVLGIRAMIEPTDEELVKESGAESIEKLKESFHARIEDYKKQAEKSRMGAEIKEHLLKKAKFELPQSEVESQANVIINDIAREEARGQEDIQSYISEHVEEIRAKALEAASEIVRYTYICKAIAKEQEIKVTKADIDGEIQRAAYYMAMREGKNAPSADELRKRIVEGGRLSYLENELRNQKVIAWIIDDIKAAR